MIYSFLNRSITPFTALVTKTRAVNVYALFVKGVGFVFLLLFTACGGGDSKNEDKKIIARVNDDYLYEENIRDFIPYGTSSKDSIELLKKHIDNWVRSTLVIQKAEDNLSDEQKNVEKQLQDYRNSLIAYTYERELIRQKLDTAITTQEIETYYNNNKSNFELRDNIIKVIYVKVSKKAPGVAKVEKLYKSDNPKDKQLLTDFCRQFAENFYLDDNSWLLFDDLLKEIPIQTYNKELFLQNNRLVEVSDSLYHYYLNIKGFKTRNSASPLSFEMENIKNIILNKRKLQLITSMKEELYNNAVNNKNIEIFNNDNSKQQ